MDDIALEESKLDELRQQLIMHDEKLSYIRLGRIIRGDTTTDDTRINWSPDALSTYLHVDGDAAADTPDEMADALLSWLRRNIRNNWDGSASQIWKLRGYGAKGETTLFTMRLNASQANQAAPEEPQEAGRPLDGVRPPTENAWDALDRAYRQLGTAQAQLSRNYNQFSDIALGWQRRLMGIATELQQQTMEHLNADRAHLRKHAQDLSQRLDSVIGEFSTFKVELLGLGMDAAELGLQRQQSQETTAKLGEKFMGTLGELGTAYFTAQGLTPTLAKLLKTLTGDPEINAVLNDPDLPGLLEDPQNRQMLAALLKQGLELYRQQKQAEKQAEAARQAEAAKQQAAGTGASGKDGAAGATQRDPDPPGGI